MQLLITIDTEEDDAWGAKPGVTTENVTHLGRFQTLCDRFAFPPTWLTTTVVLEDPRFAQALGPSVAAGRAEIGAHLHPWNCPPFANGAAPDPTEQFYGFEIPTSEYRAKMERVVERITRDFGVAPVSHRAGRWGFTPSMVPTLLELGLRVDTSVTPHLSWHRFKGMRNGDGGPDFRGAPYAPYWLDPADVRKPGSSSMLELPTTVLFTEGAFASLESGRRLVDGVRYGVAGKVLQRLGWTGKMFRPWHGNGAKELARIAAQAEGLGLPYAMLMFHSSELMPGGSPYNPDAASIERLYALFEELFTTLRSRGMTGATVRGFSEPYLKGEISALRG